MKLINTIEPNFIFNDKPINKFNTLEINNNNQVEKTELLKELKKQINSIENCNLKDNSQNLVLGDGNINSSIMLIGEAPGAEEDKTITTFQGDVGKLLDKTISAITALAVSCPGRDISINCVGQRSKNLGFVIMGLFLAILNSNKK